MPKKIPTFKGHSFKPGARDFKPAPTETDQERKKFYNSTAWKRLRAVFLADNPLCVDCLERDELTPAMIPHHVEERTHNPARALDASNLMALCSSCHTIRHNAQRPAPRNPLEPRAALTLAIDFNGVLHDHVKGGKGIVEPGSPVISGAIPFLKSAVEVFTVAIVSARFSGAGSEGIDSQIAARTWLIHHGIPSSWVTIDPDRSGRIYLTGSKVAYHLLIDDRATRFTGVFPAVESIRDFKPWNR